MRPVPNDQHAVLPKVVGNMHLIAPIFAVILFACSPPPAPTVYTARIEASTEHWQSQLLGSAPGSAAIVRVGDRVTLDIGGKIVYKRTLGGLRATEAGPTGAGSSPIGNAGYCKRAPAGALIWRIGDSGRCAYARDGNSVTFTADSEGPLQFIVNDRAGSYRDNSGSFHVSVTVVRN